jgi:hypothetical protein
MKWHRWAGPLAILVSCIFLGLPLLGTKFLPTHDGEYHIIRFMEFYRMLSDGYMFPRWAPTLNSGFGIPIFLFHYPFPNYVGSALHILGFSFVDAFKLSLFLAYTLAAGFLYLFLVVRRDRWSAWVGTMAALLVPYWFLDIYVRGSIGEVWAFAWFFAALAALSRHRFGFAAMSIALLITSHNIQAMILFPFIVMFAWPTGSKGMWSIAIGCMLSAYFWLPALIERSFVVGLNTVNPLDHFASWYELLIPSWGSQFSGATFVANKMSLQIGVMPLAWCLVAGWLVLRRGGKIERKNAVAILVLATLVIWLMLPASSSAWTSLPGLAYIQYPWRLLSLTIPLVAAAASYAASKLSKAVAGVLVLLSILFVYGYTRPAVYEPRDDAYYQSRPSFTDGTSSMGNAFSTVWTGWVQKRATDPAILLSGTGTISTVSHGWLDLELTVFADAESVVRVNTAYFPGWTVRENGISVPIEYEKSGRIDIPVGPGTHQLRVRFEDTPIRIVGNIVSLTGLFWLCGSAILRGIYAYRNRHISHQWRPRQARHRAVHKRTRWGP